MVAAIAAAFAVYFSAISTRAAMRANKREADWQSTQTRHRYYRAIVADPILMCLSEFRDDAKEIVDRHEVIIRTLHANDGTSDEIHEAIRQLTDEYAERQVVMMASITAATQAWGHAKLREDARKAAEEVQTSVAESFPALSHRESDLNFPASINDCVGQVARIIQDYDPVFLTKNED